MKKIQRFLCVFTMICFLLPHPAQAGIPTTCVNCSNFIQQMLDSITFANELSTMIKQYKEMVEQTKQQLYMAQSEAKRLMTLPGDLVGKYTNHYMALSSILDDLNMYRGDISALTDIYRQAYPDLNAMLGLATDNKDPNAIQEEWRKRSQKTDKIAEQAFKLSAAQLHELNKNPERKRQHIESLLKQKNETQIMQSANELSSMMINELHDLKSLTAMSLQHDADLNLKNQKQEQLDRGLWERATQPTDARFNYKGKVRF